jgi:hypothetical protein
LADIQFFFRVAICYQSSREYQLQLGLMTA